MQILYPKHVTQCGKLIKLNDQAVKLDATKMHLNEIDPSMGLSQVEKISVDLVDLCCEPHQQWRIVVS